MRREESDKSQRRRDDDLTVDESPHLESQHKTLFTAEAQSQWLPETDESDRALKYL